jgi:hypothetical protein
MHLHVGKAILCVFVAGCNTYTYEHLHMESKGNSVSVALLQRVAMLLRSSRRSESASCRVRHGG